MGCRRRYDGGALPKKGSAAGRHHRPNPAFQENGAVEKTRTSTGCPATTSRYAVVALLRVFSMLLLICIRPSWHLSRFVRSTLSQRDKNVGTDNVNAKTASTPKGAEAACTTTILRRGNPRRSWHRVQLGDDGEHEREHGHDGDPAEQPRHHRVSSATRMSLLRVPVTAIPTVIASATVSRRLRPVTSNQDRRSRFGVAR